MATGGFGQQDTKAPFSKLLCFKASTKGSRDWSAQYVKNATVSQRATAPDVNLVVDRH